MKIKLLKRPYVALFALWLCGVSLPGGMVHAQSDADGWYDKGYAAFSAGQMVDAERGYLIALRKDPAHRLSHVGLLDLYMAQRRYDDALEYADQALARYPSNGRFWRYKGLVLNRTDEIADAKQAFDNAYNAAPNDLSVVRAAEDFLYERGFDAEAAQMTELRKLLEAEG